MFRFLVVLSVFVYHVLAAPSQFSGQRIVGGELTTIDRYPFQAVLLMTWNFNIYGHICGATILNARSILTAAHCFTFFTDPDRFRIRVGSTYANSGGVVHNVQQNILHENYNPSNMDFDVAIVRSASIFVFTDVVQPAVIAGSSYIVADDQPVWAVGWGATVYGGPTVEELRHVQVNKVNQANCRTRYMEITQEVTNNMLCSGILDVGGKDQCQGDSGGPLIHNNVVIGVCSWGEECALAKYPGVNARVSRFSRWIQINA